MKGVLNACVYLLFFESHLSPTSVTPMIVIAIPHHWNTRSLRLRKMTLRIPVNAMMLPRSI